MGKQILPTFTDSRQLGKFLYEVNPKTLTAVEWLNQKILQSTPQEFAENYEKWVEIAKLIENKHLGDFYANGFDFGWEQKHYDFEIFYDEYYIK